MFWFNWVVSIFIVDGEPGPSDGDRAVGGAVVQPRDSGHGRACRPLALGAEGEAVPVGSGVSINYWAVVIWTRHQLNPSLTQ